MFAACPLPEEGGRTGLQLRREAAARRSVPKNSASSGEDRFPGGEHSECGANSGEACVPRRKRQSDRALGAPSQSEHKERTQTIQRDVPRALACEKTFISSRWDLKGYQMYPIESTLFCIGWDCLCSQLKYTGP